MAVLIEQQDYEDLYGVANVGRLFNDVGGDTVDATLLAKNAGIASRRMEGLLFKGFPDLDKIAQLAADNEELRALGAMLGIGIRALARPGIMAPDGTTPLSAWESRAEKTLKEIASGERRLSSEATVGRNALVGAATQPRKTPVFRSTRCDRQGPGGF